ncbi:hypothetical protein GALMADRAFT_223915 [Galerina marginata CBS 339.88]|uniref:1-alkyl-2-acetylglycerophosphocholine esterase n=1 Tax=Galerina marginata (strain CBS 339.88) TaxID=685588 RepID=A0A067T634_GALM3|nr:hypothetical protein GALMADRAFT_223915 [Galerina marginata CBS 339.88]
MSFTKSTIKIPSATNGWKLDTWEYLPTGQFSKPFPVIVMAHGLSGNKMMSLAPYAES